MAKAKQSSYQDITFVCECGAKFLAGSTLQKDFKTEICSNCHPFYTGKQKLIDSSGRVDKFMAKRKKADDLKAKTTAKGKKKTSKDEDIEDEDVEVVEETPKAEEAPQAKEDAPTEEAA